MENRSGELPEEIIQHIQSFLKTTKERAKTILISKSWLSAWSSHPCLSFRSDEVLDYDSLYNIIDRTLTSYVDRGISIIKFNLSHLSLNDDDPGLEEEWFKMVRQSNVTKLDLALFFDRKREITFFQEIFLNKSLQVLKLEALQFLFFSNPSVEEPELDLVDKDIKCLNLKKLKLRHFRIHETTFHHIMTSCPLIESLLLGNCLFIAHETIKSFRFSGQCPSLKRLILYGTNIYDEMLQAILSNSPMLEDLQLNSCDTLTNSITLSCVSLKRLYIGDICVSVVLIDVPNLNEIMYIAKSISGKHPFPFMTTSPITKEMVEVTTAYSDGQIDESWFYGLKEFLMKFAKSNVKLTSSYGPGVWGFKEFRSTPIPLWHKVDTLKFTEYQEQKHAYAFFAICHPKIVTFARCSGIDLRKFVAKLLKYSSTERGNLKCCKSDQNKCWRHYIKDVKLSYLVSNEMKPLDMNRLKRGWYHKEVITLALEWHSRKSSDTKSSSSLEESSSSDDEDDRESRKSKSRSKRGKKERKRKSRSKHCNSSSNEDETDGP